MSFILSEFRLIKQFRLNIRLLMIKHGSQKILRRAAPDPSVVIEVLGSLKNFHFH